MKITDPKLRIAILFGGRSGERHLLLHGPSPLPVSSLLSGYLAGVHLRCTGTVGRLHLQGVKKALLSIALSHSTPIGVRAPGSALSSRSSVSI